MAFLIPNNLKSRKDVPSHIHTIARSFQVGLDDNVTVWYEPLYDPSGEKPHFVILFPNVGIVVLEVLEAQGTKVLGFFRGKVRMLRDGREIEANNPLVRAEKLADILRKRIDSEPRLKGLEIPVHAGAIFHSLTMDKVKEVGGDKVLDLNKCLFKTDIEKGLTEDGESNYMRAFRRILGSFSEKSFADKENILRGLIHPDTVIDHIATPIQGTQLVIFRPPSEEEDAVRVMDRKQEAMAKESFKEGGHYLIKGVAGSGKTLILIYRAKFIAGNFPNRRILYTCYTRALASQIREILKDYPNIDVINLDKLMFDLIKRAGMVFPGYCEGKEGEVPRIALQALDKISVEKYDEILLDEAQDFGIEYFKFVVKLLSNERGSLLLVADTAQNIFKRKFTWKEAGIHVQGRTKILKVNYRNTKEILSFAFNFLLSDPEFQLDEVPDDEDDTKIIPPESAVRSGPRPIIKISKNTHDEIRAVVQQTLEWIEKGAKNPKDIAILYSSSHGDKGENIAKIMFDELLKARIDVFWLNNPDDKRARDKIGGVRNNVILSTIHNAKGMEFPRVVLFNLWKKGEEPKENRKLVYVGMTRAMEYLSVIVNKSNPFSSDLMKCNDTI